MRLLRNTQMIHRDFTRNQDQVVYSQIFYGKISLKDILLIFYCSVALQVPNRPK